MLSMLLLACVRSLNASIVVTGKNQRSLVVECQKLQREGSIQRDRDVVSNIISV